MGVSREVADRVTRWVGLRVSDPEKVAVFLNGLLGAGTDPPAVSVCPDLLWAAEIRSTDGRHLPAPLNFADKVALVFVDLHPKAKWPHPCFYVVIPIGGPAFHVNHTLPPDLAPMSRFSR